MQNYTGSCAFTNINNIIKNVIQKVIQKVSNLYGSPLKSPSCRFERF